MNVSRALSRVIAVTGGIEAIDALYATYDQVSVEDVREAARRYLVSQRRTVAVLRGRES
jgi:uncharacterized protein (DUF433 family)